MQSLDKIDQKQLDQYLNYLWCFETPELQEHKKLLEWQLGKTPDNAALKTVVAKITAILAGEKSTEIHLMFHSRNVTAADTNERYSFRLYAPKAP
ncbi:hypothetical protein EON80_15630 [bacterium]|nr:MAG: hypothetical protein EON80_15630 [bacterium]